MTEFERTVTFAPGFDRRHADPNKDYGVHGVTVRWTLTKNSKAVQFVVYTDWYPLNVQEGRMQRNRIGEHVGVQPMAADLGYHSPAPRYEGQRMMDNHCAQIGGPCYYDGSGLNAEPVRDRLLAEGGDAVWDELERYWDSTFGGHDESRSE